jgi:CheY-like chemotaxis protein
MTRVLVIDDDESIRVAIETLLRHQDCIVVLADSGHVGTKTFEAFSFDVVMVDIFMPGMDGLETIKTFHNRAPAVPIVAMSGFRFRSTLVSAPDFLGMAAELGATYCLRKPFGQRELMTAINACLGHKFPIRSAVEA